MAYNTGNPIGSTDARDLSDNAQDFDEAVLGTGATWTDRLGVERRTLRSAVGYTGTGTDGAIESYSPGLVLNGYNVIILYSGEFYRPSASATLPYTTTATLPDVDSNLVSIGDAKLRQDLTGDPADGLGAALVNGVVIRVTSITEIEALTGVLNYQVSLSGSRAQTFAFSTANLSAEVASDAAQGKYIAPSFDATGASGAWVSLQSTVLARHFGITPSSSDNSGAWQSLLNFKPGHVHFDEVGNYTFLSSSDHDTSISVTAVPGAVFDCTDVGFTGNHWTKFTGAFPQIENLGIDAVKGARTLTFLSAPSLSVGDVFVIWNPAPSSWSGFRSAYNAGEFCRVVSISGNDVVISGELYDDYVLGAANIFRLDSIQVNLDNLDIRGNTSFGLLDLEFCRDSVLNNIKAFNRNNSILTLQRCFNVSVINPAMHNVGDGGDDYGIVVTNSQNIKVIGGDVYSRRHAITTGGDIDPGNVPCRNLKFIGITLSNDINSGTHCADFHGNTEDSSYENCEIHGGATWQGKNNGYINCRIGSILVGVCILASEILGGRHYAKNCSFHTIVNPKLASRGLIDIGGNTLPVKEFTVDPCVFEITGCKVKGRNFAAGTSIMIMKNRGASVDMNIVIYDLSLDVDNLGQILFTDLVSGTASSEFIVVDDIKSHGTITGKLLVLHSGDSYQDFPHKLQKQSGAETVTSSTSSSTVSSSAVDFNWVYPRTPVAIVGRNGRGYLGNRIGIPYADPLSSTGLTANLSTDDVTNFGSATTVELHWRVGIDEL
jgi:hypothetical protein